MTSVPVVSSDDLRRTLERISGRGYKAYKDIEGGYQFPGFVLFIDHVQGDPFAAPSRIRVKVPAERAGFPDRLFTSTPRRIGLEDWDLAPCARTVSWLVGVAVERPGRGADRRAIRWRGQCGGSRYRQQACSSGKSS